MIGALLRSAPQELAAPVAGAGELSMRGLGKRFGSVEALRDFSLALGEGEIVAVTGPSGAGKTTLGRLVSGLERASAGSITLGDLAFSDLPPQGRRVAHMFESFALYPTRTVWQNVASPLDAPTSAGRWQPADKARRISEVLELTGIAALRERLPSQLSGGQKQRVALCRALVQSPSVFVLDEPIGHLDAQLRHALRGEIRRRQGRLRQGTLWLTPDGIEALAVAHRVVVLIGGRVQQVGTPDSVFTRPANVQVARLIGDPAMNVLAAELRPGDQPCLRIGGAEPVPVSAALLQHLGPHARDGRLQLGLRPGGLRLLSPNEVRSPRDAVDRLIGRVYAVEPLGKSTILTLDVGGERVRARLPAVAGLALGAPAVLGFAAEDTLAFDTASGLLLT